MVRSVFKIHDRISIPQFWFCVFSARATCTVRSRGSRATFGRVRKARMGLFIDEKADERQRQALQSIFAGEAGGWPAGFAANESDRFLK